MEKIVILGSTGSIGRQALAVLRRKNKYFRVMGLAAKNETPILLRQIKEFKPEIVVLAEEKAAKIIQRLFPRLKVYWGEKALVDLTIHQKVQTILFATSGIVGLEPLIAAIKKRKKIILANKESLVTAGEIINQYLDRYRGELLPLDSEHSAIWQCLRGENITTIKNLILTASGGPLRDYSYSELNKVTPGKVLNHPVWKMGPKITVDSATLMNKGFEVLEAHYLFRVPFEKIKVIIHPEAIIHSLVEFQDGNIKALLSWPDMKIPIQYALSYPRRVPYSFNNLDLSQIKKLLFFSVNQNRFPCLGLAYWAGKIGKTMPAVLVYTDEIVVQNFLQRKIKFLDIPKIIKRILKIHRPISKPTIEEIVGLREWVDKKIKEIIK